MSDIQNKLDKKAFTFILEVIKLTKDCKSWKVFKGTKKDVTFIFMLFEI